MGVQVSFYKIYYSLTNPQKDQVQLTELHKARMVKRDGVLTYNYSPADKIIAQTDSAKCMACHGDMKGDTKKYLIHDKMLSHPMLNFLCTHCHKQVDIRGRTPGRATITVDRSICPTCHAAPLVNKEEAGPRTAPGLSSVPPHLPQLLVQHGNDKKEGAKWVARHPRVAMALGIKQCRKCHIVGSELDFCNDCHLRGGFRPASHKALYNVPIKTIYPESKTNKTVSTKWKGYHFVLVKDSLKKMGTTVKSAQNLPMDQISKLPCGACHVLEDWCTRCHIKHNSNWLHPADGHSGKVTSLGTSYCFRCHDQGGAKCLSCHEYVGKIQ